MAELDPMAAYFGLPVAIGGPVRAASVVADQAEQDRQRGGDWRDILGDIFQAGRDAVIGVIGEKARSSPAGQEYERKATAQTLGELLMGPVGIVGGGLLLLLLLSRR